MAENETTVLQAKSGSQSEFRASNLDCGLAIIIAIGLPLICNQLYPLTGALIPLLLYYGVCCVGVVLWRKKSLEYRRAVTWALPVFITMFVIQVFQQIVAIISKVNFSYTNIEGTLLTLFIWVPINSSMEQLSWLYVYDAFATRYSSGRKKIGFSVIGLILMFTLVGMIHALFWGLFTPALALTSLYGIIFLAVQFVTLPLYIVLYRKSRSMLPLALIHCISDIGLVLVLGFNILPFLVH